MPFDGVRPAFRSLEEMFRPDRHRTRADPFDDTSYFTLNARGAMTMSAYDNARRNSRSNCWTRGDETHLFPVKHSLYHKFEVYFSVLMIINVIQSLWVLVSWFRETASASTLSSPCVQALFFLKMFACGCILEAIINLFLKMLLPVAPNAPCFSALVLSLLPFHFLALLGKAVCIASSLYIVRTRGFARTCVLKDGLYTEADGFVIGATVLLLLQLSLGSLFLYAAGIQELYTECRHNFTEDREVFEHLQTTATHSVL